MPHFYSVGKAKERLPQLIRESSEAQKFFRVGNANRHNAPRSWIIGEESMETLLSFVRFTPQWEEDPGQGLWTVYVPELDIWGQGETQEMAAEDLLETVEEYAVLYLEDVPFYRKAGRKEHLPYVLTMALAAGNNPKMRKLLGV